MESFNPDPTTQKVIEGKASAADTKPIKRSRKSAVKQEASPTLWSDTSIAKLFSLRYKSSLAARFDSKNNAGKRVAYVMLAAELSLAMEREYTVLQIQDKLAKLKTAWSTSKPTLPGPTGNEAKQAPPQYYDIMLEYWGDKVGFQRESLMSTDDVDKEEPKILDVDSADEKPATKRAKREANPPARRQGDALEAGFNAIKEGLVFLGTSLNSAQQPVSSASTGVTGATLDDVVRALNVQSATMEKLLAHLADKNQ
ncbi:hypothetical protein AaE_013548 [Aphanomyces astaci]|uniref:Uncharacterized protein n=1 Tax=Aphanomyces astaci TaxID=112090 RepID=A0A6A4Z6Q6_APHAT|nr:hypothetical protein AaE_013548 [Aphanomyces astaci]